jgi:mannose-6-phosphate isomerase-like protein (cupin superfamily)
VETNGREADGGDSGPVKPTRTQTQAGPIVNLNVAGNVSIIHCEANSRRSSHHHLTDWHYLFVVSGRMLYWERPAGSDEPPTQREYFPGDMVFTGPMLDHWTEFPERTTLVSVSRLHRTKETHEADLVRVPWHE